MRLVHPVCPAYLGTGCANTLPARQRGKLTRQHHCHFGFAVNQPVSRHRVAEQIALQLVAALQLPSQAARWGVCHSHWMWLKRGLNRPLNMRGSELGNR